MLNVVAIMGRLAADPQLRQTTTGKNVASFRIACDRGRRDANGQSQADWLDVVAWDRTAEFVCKYFQKGSLIAIDGRLQSRSYQDKNGNNRTAIEIVANNVNFAAPKSANAAPMGDAGYGAPTAAPAPRPAAQAAPAPSYSAGSNDDFALIEDEGDLPFQNRKYHSNKEVSTMAMDRSSRPMHRGRKKVCSFCVDRVEHIDYKDLPRLRKYVSERAKIIPRRVTGTCAFHQRELTVAIKRARHVALLPYVSD